MSNVPGVQIAEGWSVSYWSNNYRHHRVVSSDLVIGKAPAVGEPGLEVAKSLNRFGARVSEMG